MRTTLPVMTLVLALGVSVMGQARPPLGTTVAQPSVWIPFASTVQHNGVTVGRFWRDGHGSTRMEWDVADAEGRTILIQNVPQAKYYVYRPGAGRTVQPTVLPTTGWRPLPMLDVDAGTAGAEPADGMPVYERQVQGKREQRVPALNFFAVSREVMDGVTERHTQIRGGQPPPDLFAPPPGATVTELATPGGIVALPGGAR